MEGLLHDIVALLIALGPWVVFFVALSETAVFLGLLIPAEATVLVAAFLAYRGVFPLEQIFAATFFGGLVGDQVGYLLGRHGGTRIVARSGRVRRMWDRYDSAASDLFRRHSALAVTLARFISFVRTLAPWFAGMSRLSYPRFLLYDLIGVFGWAAGSVALGYLAGESWHLIADVLGVASGAAVALVGLVFILIAIRRRRARSVEG